jgi:hypothetical protein
MLSQTPEKRIKAIRIVIIGLYLLAIGSFVTPLHVKASPLILWEKFIYQDTIPVGQGLYHQHELEGAESASAHIVSSNGKASLTYQWNYPWLYVSIVNMDTKPVTVTWEEDFYVV